MEKETKILYINDFNELKNNSWSGAVQTLEEIERLGKEQELIDFLNCLIADCYDGAIDETTLNDILWFEDEFINESLNIKMWEK